MPSPTLAAMTARCTAKPTWLHVNHPQASHEPHVTPGIHLQLELHSPFKYDNVGLKTVFHFEECTTLARSRLQNKTGVEVVKLPKSGGVVTRSPAVRKAARVRRVREYFYGPRGDLLPHVVELTFDEASIFRVGGKPRADASALPIGECQNLAVHKVPCGLRHEQCTRAWRCTCIILLRT